MQSNESVPNVNIKNGENEFGLGVLLTALLTGIVSCIFGGVRALFIKAKNIILEYIKRKVYSFFNWENTSAHKLQKNPNSNRYDIRTCCICLNNIKNTVMSVCNHPFCADCIVDMWKIKQKKKLNCPYCRREMNLLYRDFEENEIRTAEEKKTLKELKEYNAIYSTHQRTWLEMIKDSPFLLRVLMQKITEWKNMWFVLTTMVTSGRLIASLLYIISPIDLLPEILLGPIGLIDDFAVVGIALVTIANISYQLLSRE